MKITLLFTGKTKEKYLREGIDEYVKRIKRYVPFNSISIPDLKVTKKTGLDYIKIQEGSQLLQRIKAADFVILLDEKGSEYSSVGFAKYISDLEGKTGHLVFVIGGAYGFSKELLNRANAKVSLSKMTFSHQIVRLIFTEQLYRACTIIKGEPYHHK